MPSRQASGPEDWRLGIDQVELPDRREPAPERRRRPDLSALRLERPLYVLTVEHVGWIAVTLYAVVSRLVALSVRPLDLREARDAVSALDFSIRGLSALSAQVGARWPLALETLIFSIVGAGDLAARLVFAAFGLMLIGAAASMRSHLGRAGALAFAAILTLSPSVAYFSRTASSAVPAAALVTMAVALGCAISRRPGVGKA